MKGFDKTKKPVVNEKLEVIGIDGLRIADNSVYPFVPAGHTVLPAMLVGEKASDMIINKYTLN